MKIPDKLSFSLAVLCAAACFGFCAPAAAKGADYDVLYFSGPDQAGFKAARAKIAHILGPDVERRLRVRRNGDRYGLVYARHGDLGSAAAVARSQARMLAPHGVQAPVPVKAQDWVEPQNTAVKAVPVRTEAQVKPAEPPKPAEPAKPAAQAAAPVQPSAATAAIAATFEARMNLYLENQRKTGGIKKDESTAWAVYDLTDNAKLAGVNEDLLLQTASLVKPFIALAYFHEVEQGRQQYTATAKKRLEEMIRDSDNAAADWFMRLLGGPDAVQRLLKQNYGVILHDLLLVEYIPRNGHTYRNKASVQDYTAFLHALWNDKLPSSAEIKRVMILPKRNRLYTGTHGLPESTEVYDKTGTTSRLCGDMGILVALRADGQRFPYIIIGLIQKNSPASRYFSWMHKRGDIIRHVSVMAYEEIALRHHFREIAAERESAGAAGPDNGIVVSSAVPTQVCVIVPGAPVEIGPAVAANGEKAAGTF